MLTSGNLLSKPDVTKFHVTAFSFLEVRHRGMQKENLLCDIKVDASDLEAKAGSFFFVGIDT